MSQTLHEKANELFVKIYELIPDNVINENHIAAELAKQCALVTAGEILDALSGNYELFYDKEYWNEVKTEIEKL